jgi:hypothetical protein
VDAIGQKDRLWEGEQLLSRSKSLAVGGGTQNSEGERLAILFFHVCSGQRGIEKKEMHGPGDAGDEGFQLPTGAVCRFSPSGDLCFLTLFRFFPRPHLHLHSMLLSSLKASL